MDWQQKIEGYGSETKGIGLTTVKLSGKKKTAINWKIKTRARKTIWIRT